MKRRCFITIQIFISLVLITMFFASCTSGNNKKTIKPPPIPPQSTFVMDFSDFVQSKSSDNPSQMPIILLASFSSKKDPVITAPNALGDHSNWVFAAL